MKLSELFEESKLKNIGDLVNKSHQAIKDKLAADKKKSKAQRSSDTYDEVEARYKNIGKFITGRK